MQTPSYMPTPKDSLAEMFANVSLGSPDNAVGFVLWRVVHRFQREMDRALRPCDLTHLQFTTLAMAAWLCRGKGCTRQTEIARRSAIHPMQVSLMLKALEAKALIVRNRDRERTNTNIVEITQRGVDALVEAMPLAVELQRRMFGSAGKPTGALLKALLHVEKSLEVTQS